MAASHLILQTPPGLMQRLRFPLKRADLGEYSTRFIAWLSVKPLAAPNPCLLVTGGKSELWPQLEHAAHLAFGNPLIREMLHVKHARQAEVWTIPEILVLIDPDELTLSEARGAVDDAGLARWAIVVFRSEGETTDLEANPTGDPIAMARAFKTSLREYGLQRETGILRGCLWSVGRRIAHDLRTPLGCIVTGAEALNERLGDRCSVEIGLVRPILESAESMEDLLKRTSFLARACGTPAAKSTCSMGMAFWTAFQMLESDILNQKAVLVQPQSWPEIQGVDAWMEVIWWNLLSNALRHTGDSPKIEVGWEKLTNEYRFWIRDNGAGVPFEKQKSLFFPFHRMHEPSAPQGLGLPTVQHLVNAQGGTCGYEPVEGGGGAFYFGFPVEDPVEPVPEAKLEQIPNAV